MPNIRNLKEIVMADVRNNSSDTEREWLSSREIVLLWHRELFALKADLNQQINRRRTSMKRLAPLAGQHPTIEYSLANREFKEWRTKVLFLIERIDSRHVYVSTLIRSMGLDIDNRTTLDILQQIKENIDTHQAQPEVAIRHVKQLVEQQLSRHYTPPEPLFSIGIQEA